MQFSVVFHFKRLWVIFETLFHNFHFYNWTLLHLRLFEMENCSIRKRPFRIKCNDLLVDLVWKSADLLIRDLGSHMERNLWRADLLIWGSSPKHRKHETWTTKLICISIYIIWKYTIYQLSFFFNFFWRVFQEGEGSGLRFDIIHVHIHWMSSSQNYIKLHCIQLIDILWPSGDLTINEMGRVLSKLYSLNKITRVWTTLRVAECHGSRGHIRVKSG